MVVCDSLGHSVDEYVVEGCGQRKSRIGVGWKGQETQGVDEKYKYFRFFLLTLLMLSSGVTQTKDIKQKKSNRYQKRGNFLTLVHRER